MKADVVVDIETIVNPVTTSELEEYMKTIPTIEQARAEYAAPKSWKDPVKLEEHREKFEAKIVVERRDAEKNAVQTILDGKRFSIHGKRMVSCAFGVADSYSQQVTNIQSCASDDLTEICLFIQGYLSEYPDRRLIGWNHTNFDFPEIQKSFALTKTAPPKGRFGKWDIVDLSVTSFRKEKLKSTAKAFGYDIPDTDGSAVAALHEAGNWDAIKKYNEHDVLITGQLYLAASSWVAF